MAIETNLMVEIDKQWQLEIGIGKRQLSCRFFSSGNSNRQVTAGFLKSPMTMASKFSAIDFYRKASIFDNSECSFRGMVNTMGTKVYLSK